MDSLKIDNDLLIEEIKKRPALYDTSIADYHDVNCRKLLWVEVCEIVLENWNNLSSSVKNERVFLVQRKWRNQRNYFIKKIRKTSFTKPKDKLKYINGHQLSFLLPLIDYSDSINNPPTPPDSNDGAESKSDEVSDYEKRKAQDKTSDEEVIKEDFPTRPNNNKQDAAYEEPFLEILQQKRHGEVVTEDFLIRLENKEKQGVTYKEPPLENLQQKRNKEVVTEYLPMRPPNKKKKQDVIFEKRLLEILQQKRQEDSIIDEDKLFLMSLVPTFKKLNEEQKFEAKMEIMQTLKRVLFSRYPTSNLLQMPHSNRPPELSTSCSHPIESSSDAVKVPSTSSNLDIIVEPRSTFVYKSEILSPGPVEEVDTDSDVSSF